MNSEIQTAIEAAVKQLFDVETTVELTRPEAQFGDYATNVALKLSKQVGKNPRQIADQLAETVKQAATSISEVSVAGPGFLNIKLTDAALWQQAQSSAATPLAGQTILAEYSDPNPFKPLHAGHLYTTLVGDAIARLLQLGGASVVRLNYGGDVGLHVGKTMWSIIQHFGGEQPAKLSEIPEAERADWLGQRYVEGNAAYDDETSKTEILAVNKRVYELHASDDHESDFAQIYWTCRQWSYEYFSHLYQELQVHPFDRVIPESEVTALGVETVKQQLAAGVYQESDGAVIFKGEDYGLHTRVFINSQGLPTYEAKDVGLLLIKWQDYSFDKSIVMTAHEQAQYFQVMLKSVEQFAPEPAQRSVHLSHGMVKLAGGVKMSSRMGNTVGAIDILETAAAANKQATGQDSPDTVLGAVKYAFLKNRIGGDIVYIPEESVSLEGNSGPYLQYAHARARSILRKADAPGDVSIDQLDDAERVLVHKLSEYAETLDRAVDELMPHHICSYLYELAQVFNRFYEQSRVIGDDRQDIRLALVAKYADTLKRGLSILGIASPDEM